MMKKIIGWIIVMAFIALYVVSDSGLIRYVARSAYRGNSIWASDKYRYGDLYGFSYLKQFKFHAENKDDITDRGDSLTNCATVKDINLYGIWDSYLFNFVKSDDFCRVNKYAYIRSIDDGKLNVVLDKSKINVLLIERAERQIKDDLSDTAYWGNRLAFGGGSEGMVSAVHHGSMTDFSFNRDINANLEFTLFDHRLFTPVKEFKAWLNYKVFNRVDEDVYVSRRGDRLYYKATIDSFNRKWSSFAAITKEDMDHYDSVLDHVMRRYKTLGFDYVYFCGIPNPGTIHESRYLKYNDFLPRLEKGSQMQGGIIDIYSLFMSSGEDLFQRSDTHWNVAGYQTWLHVFNNILDTIPAHPPLQ